MDVENLTVQFGDNVVVDDVSVSADRGEILGVLGPNGAGKSCMFRAMLGLLPHRGRVSFFGTDPGAQKYILPLIGYVPQKIDYEPLFPATVHDSLPRATDVPPYRMMGTLDFSTDSEALWNRVALFESESTTRLGSPAAFIT